jgi:O-acetyl-ADP-ribose deacetylase (regulator of RNase III)
MQVINMDILNATTDYIGHQVNCKGVMGSGVARVINENFSPYIANYFSACKAFSRRSEALLGSYIQSPLPDGRSIIHLFGQDGYGYDRKYTVEHALQKALIRFCNDLPNDRKYTIALPYKIGCGRGGANWDDVYYMLQMVEGQFSDKIEIILHKIN